MKLSMPFVSLALVLAFAAGLLVARSTTAADDDVAGVRAQCEAFKGAWNKHDPKAMAAVFAEDGDAINPFGHKAVTRAEIEKMFGEEQTGKGPLRESTVEVTDEPIRFITSDVAISDADAVVTGAFGPDGKKAGPMGVRVTNIWKKSAGKWWVFASRPCLKPAPK